MKLSEITAILADASLPALAREQLLELAGTQAGKQFQGALLAFADGDHGRRDELEATVRVLHPNVRDVLRRLGSNSTVDQLVAAACREQRRFFDAVDAIADKTVRSSSARTYLADIGIVTGPNLTAQAPAADPPYYNFSIYGSAAALCIAEATTRSDRKHTINVEGAIALPGGGVRKTFDWPNKIVVQLTVQEAYELLALLENKIRSLRFDGHGREHNKSLQIEFQDSHYFFRLIQRGRAAVAVPVRAVDSLQIVSLLYRQLLRNEPHLRIDDLRLMVDRMATMSPTR